MSRYTLTILNHIKFVLISALLGTLTFCLGRLATWVGSLTTTRLPFYFTFNYYATWVMALLVFGGALYLLEHKD